MIKKFSLMIVLLFSISFSLNMDSLKTVAILGDKDAQYDIGVLYVDGYSIPRDYKAGFKWLKAAAEQGHPKAQQMVGISYSLGRGVAIDEKESIRWMEKAANNGLVSAKALLGVALLEDFGEIAEGKKWLTSAAEDGDEVAQFYLGHYILTEDKSGKNNEYAIMLLEKSSRQGFHEAQYYLGLCYILGKGVDKNMYFAADLIQEAVDNGHGKAKKLWEDFKLWKYK